MEFNFIASNVFDLNSLKDIEKFVENYSDFQTIVLNDENELKLLFQTMGINEFIEEDFKGGEFSKCWNISTVKLPEFDNAQLDKFYENWIEKSHRENSMDEYGSLIFLCGLSSEWNKLNYRLIVR